MLFGVASAEAKSSVIQEKEERLFPLPSTRNQFLVGGFAHSQRDGAPEGVQGAIGKPLVASAEAKSSVIWEKEERLFPLPSTRNQFLVGVSPTHKGMGPPKGSRGRSESPLVASVEAKSSVIWEKEGRPFPLPSTRNQFLVEGITHSQRDGPPKGSRGRSESPLVASAEAKSSVIQEK